MNTTRPGAGFGTFKGVFTPSILTILGVIMYLRLGWVLGNLGLPATLVVVTLSSLVTFVTGLSIAATATNMRVGGGGAYFMISRSLGLSAGAAIGLPLFIAQALGVSFYVVGFAEAVRDLIPGAPQRVVGVITLAALTALAYRSADLALRAQFFILAAILVSLAAFFTGGPPDAGFAPVAAVPEAASFWVVFAVFFPAVTGIEAGVAMSGDLKDPGRSLPRGTLSAVVVGWAVYVVIPILLSAWVPREVLLTDTMVMQRVASWGPAVMIGLWGASLSSALGALLGAPRTLQALARDRVLPPRLGQGHGPTDEPRIATAVTFVIALLGILLGDLNPIATVLSMFFLTSYGFLNLSAGLEGLIGSPSWRPRFATPWYVSLAGAALCFGAMLMIDAGATFAAAAVSGAAFAIMGRRQMTAYFGGIGRGLLVVLARFAVYRLNRSAPDARTWRPNLLALSGPPTARWHLVEFAQALTGPTGFLTVATIVPHGTPERARRVRASIENHLARQGVGALVHVHVTDGPLMDAATALVQSLGLGGLVPNTLLLGVSTDQGKRAGYVRLVMHAAALERNAVLVRGAEVEPPAGAHRVLVWWGGHKQNVGLMLALAHLYRQGADVDRPELHLATIAHSDEEAEHAQRRIDALLTDGRLDATVHIVRRSPDQPVFDVIRAHSRDAHQVFVGMRRPEEGETVEAYTAYYEALVAQTAGLPATAFVIAAEPVDFADIFA